MGIWCYFFLFNVFKKIVLNVSIFYSMIRFVKGNFYLYYINIKILIIEKIVYKLYSII